MKPGQGKLSRRRLLGGAAVASATLPVLHELIPHQGVHGGAGNAAAAEPHMAGMDMSGAHAAHLGTVGTVDPRANGFDPQEILRDFDEGTVRRAACASGSSWPRTRRSRSRPASSTRPGPTTGACRARRCGPARASGCESGS